MTRGSKFAQLRRRQTSGQEMELAKMGALDNLHMGQKTSVLDELVDILKKILDYCVCCLTCGCYKGKRRRFSGEVYEAELTEEERVAVQNLLRYLDSAEAKEPTINEERLRALCILAYSDNDELQRSAALCFAEISNGMRVPVTELMLEPLVILLKSKDAQVQKAASLTVSNFALNGADGNRKAIINSGAIRPLIQLLQYSNTDVQCNTCGCITSLATTEKSKMEVVNSGGVPPLLELAQSSDIRVQRNATGAVLNLTHLSSNRDELVKHGALPVLVQVLYTTDPDVQYYCAAALSNLAVSERHRAMMVAVGHFDVIKHLCRYLGSPKDKVRCQACLALRNLASDHDNQMIIVKLNCLTPLHHLMKTTKEETLVAAMAFLRNLSIHNANELVIIKETFLTELRRIVREKSNHQAQIHAAGTIRNLAAGDHIQKITESGCVEALLDATVDPGMEEAVLTEVTAALAVLSDDDHAKEIILCAEDGNYFQKLIGMTTKSSNPEVCYNCAGTIGQISLLEIPDAMIMPNSEALLHFLNNFLSNSDPAYVHIGLWTLVQLLKSEAFRYKFHASGQLSKVEDIQKDRPADYIKELADSVIERMASC